MIAVSQTKDIKRAKISAASSGNNTIVSAVSNKRIRVLALTLMSAGSVNATFQSGASGTDLTGAMPLAANTGFSPAYSPLGQFETEPGELLNLSLSAAIQVSGWMTYELDGGNSA